MNAAQEYPHEYTAAQATEIALAQINRLRTFPIIVKDGGSLVLIDRREDGAERERYDIPVDQLTTASGVAFWIRQIAPKSWVSKKHIELLAQSVIDLDVVSAGH